MDMKQLAAHISDPNNNISTSTTKTVLEDVALVLTSIASVLPNIILREGILAAAAFLKAVAEHL